MLISIITEIILAALIITSFKGLQLSNDIIIGSIKDAPEDKIIRRSAITLGALLFLLWRAPELAGEQDTDMISKILFAILIYEAAGSAAMLYYRDKYVDMLNKTDRSGYPYLIKLPVAAEILFFCYLFIKFIISEWGFLFS